MKHILSYRWFFKERRKVYAAIAALFIITNGLNIVIPKQIGDLMNSLGTGGSNDADLGGTIAILGGLAILLYALNYWKETWLMNNGVILEGKLKDRLFRGWIARNPIFFHRHSVGQLMTHLSNDTQAVGKLGSMLVLGLGNILIMLPLYIASMIAFVDVSLTIAALLPLPLIAVTMFALGKRIRRAASEWQESFGRMSEQAEETVSGIRTIRAYGQEGRTLKRFEAVTGEVMARNSRIGSIEAFFWSIITFILNVSFAIALGYGAYLIFESRLTVGQLATFTMYMWRMTFPMFALGSLFTLLQQAEASAERLSSVESDETGGRQESRTPSSSTVEAMDMPAVIESNNVAFRYPGASEDQLSGMSFRLAQGGTLAVVGPTGSGKSTLLKLLLGFYPPTAGEIMFDGRRASDIPLLSKRRWMAYVPQDPMLLSGSIRENIRFGNPDASDLDIDTVVRASNLAGDLKRMEGGLDTEVGESGSRLSGGQRQRVALARALLTGAELMVIDDAMSAVDARTSAALWRKIRTMRRGRTTVFATHQLLQASAADFILVLGEGRLLHAGTHDELMATGGWYNRQYEYERSQRRQAPLQREDGEYGLPF